MKAQLVSLPEKEEILQDQVQEAPKVVYAWESVRKIAKELLPLLLEEYEEISPYKGEYDPDPDWNAMFSMESNGVFKVLVARKQGVIVGYASFVTYRHLHYNFKSVVSDSYYVLIEHRKDRIGTTIFSMAKDKFTLDGIKKMHIHDPFGRLHKFLKRKGFKKGETLWEKTLNGK